MPWATYLEACSHDILVTCYWISNCAMIKDWVIRLQVVKGQWLLSWNAWVEENNAEQDSGLMWEWVIKKSAVILMKYTESNWNPFVINVLNIAKLNLKQWERELFFSGLLEGMATMYENIWGFSIVSLKNLYVNYKLKPNFPFRQTLQISLHLWPDCEHFVICS